MRKVTLILLIVVFCNPYLKSQNKFNFGFSAVLQHTNISNLSEPDIITSLTLRPAFSIFGELNLNHRISLMSGIGYSYYTQNANVFKNNFNYLTIPLHLKNCKKKDQGISYIQYYGFNYQYLISANHKIDGSKESIMKYCNRNHMELEFGSGIHGKFKEYYMYDLMLFAKAGTQVNKITSTGSYFNSLNFGIKLNIYLNGKSNEK